MIQLGLQKVDSMLPTSSTDLCCCTAAGEILNSSAAVQCIPREYIWDSAIFGRACTLQAKFNFYAFGAFRTTTSSTYGLQANLLTGGNEKVHGSAPMPWKIAKKQRTAWTGWSGSYLAYSYLYFSWLRLKFRFDDYLMLHIMVVYHAYCNGFNHT